MELNVYVDLAKKRVGLASDRALARELGVAHNTLRQWKAGVAKPQPGLMIRLAELAGADPEVALLDRLSWEADTPEARDMVARMRASFARAMASIVLMFALFAMNTPGSAEDNNGRTRYIMEILRLWICWWMLAGSGTRYDGGKSGPRYQGPCSGSRSSPTTAFPPVTSASSRASWRQPLAMPS